MEMNRKKWAFFLIRKYFEIEEETLLSKTRVDKANLCRQLAMYLLYRSGVDSYQGIGRFFGRHHSTVIHGCAVIEDLLEVDMGERSINVRLVIDEFVSWYPFLREIGEGWGVQANDKRGKLV